MAGQIGLVEPHAGNGELAQEIELSPWWSSKRKRLFDVLLAGLLLVLIGPLMCVIALAIRLSSPGPILFRQNRAGRGGRQFVIYKFRSMRFNGSDQGPLITTHIDLRLTPVGRILRRWKLDELPQFFNVLKGDMSLVGPRPRVFQQTQHPSMFYVRPGITSPATLAFRNEERLWAGLAGKQLERFYTEVVVPVKVTLDLEYLQEGSLLKDASLIARTALSILVSNRSYCFSDRSQLADIVANHWNESDSNERPEWETAAAGSD